jgi:hypothetical protein
MFSFSYNGAVCGLTLVKVSETEEERKVVWKNLVPAGAHHLRPSLISFEPETEDMVIRINQEHTEEVASLENFETEVDGKMVEIKYSVLNSMHDQKEVTVLTKDILR